MIHTTIGLYSNGTFKMNGVEPDHLQSHIEYNKTFRWGRSLFVDGKCVYKGYQSDEEVKAFEKRIKDENFIMTKCNKPYR